jgi:glucose/arabinose dehydrogenase
MNPLPLLLLATVCTGAMAQDGQTGYTIETVAEGLEHPWSLAFLPDGMMLVTERTGRLRVIDEGGLRAEPVGGLPPVFVSGQGGLFEVLPARDFAESRILYISYAHGDKDANHTRVLRARFDGRNLLDATAVFTSQPAKSGDAHFGGRMTWLPDGTLVMGLGDGFYFREDAQKLDTHLAKIIRIHPDGSVPADNPFVGQADAKPEIYSYGHRHVQAVVFDAASGLLYAHEHGPRGGDELNVIEPGRNYGWPMITYGRDYSRARISPFEELPGMEQPRTYWVPSIAPGGMTLYDGDVFPEWKGSLFVAALAEKSVRRVPMNSPMEPGAQQVLF